MMTVEEVFTEESIDLDMVQERSEESGSEYWENCYSFLDQKWSDPVEDLTEKQSQWVDRIREDMIEWRIKKGKRK